MAKNLAALEEENEELIQELADAEAELAQLEDQLDEIVDIAGGTSEDEGEAQSQLAARAGVRKFIKSQIEGSGKGLLHVGQLESIAFGVG